MYLPRPRALGAALVLTALLAVLIGLAIAQHNLRPTIFTNMVGTFTAAAWLHWLAVTHLDTAARKRHDTDNATSTVRELKSR